MGSGVLFPGIKRPGHEVNTHLQPVSSLRMGGAIHPIPHYDFKACSGKPYFIYFYSRYEITQVHTYIHKS
jgi:hypothetical protein